MQLNKRTAKVKGEIITQPHEHQAKLVLMRTSDAGFFLQGVEGTLSSLLCYMSKSALPATLYDTLQFHAASADCEAITAIQCLRDRMLACNQVVDVLCKSSCGHPCRFRCILEQGILRGHQILLREQLALEDVQAIMCHQPPSAVMSVKMSRIWLADTHNTFT